MLFVFSVSLSNPFSFSSIRRAGSTAFPFREVFSELRSLLINYRLVGWPSPSDCQSATCITTDSRCLSHGFILTLPSKLIRVRASRDSVRPGLLGRFWLHRQSPSEATQPCKAKRAPIIPQLKLLSTQVVQMIYIFCSNTKWWKTHFSS